MDYATAHDFILTQGADFEKSTETFLQRLRQGQPPIPGQVTSLLLALKVMFEGLQQAEQLDRRLVYSLYMLANESRYLYEQGKRQGVIWPPLLDQDLGRIAKAVRSIFSGTWES